MQNLIIKTATIYQKIYFLKHKRILSECDNINELCLCSFFNTFHLHMQLDTLIVDIVLFSNVILN